MMLWSERNINLCFETETFQFKAFCQFPPQIMKLCDENLWLNCDFDRKRFGNTESKQFFSIKNEVQKVSVLLSQENHFPAPKTLLSFNLSMLQYSYAFWSKSQTHFHNVIHSVSSFWSWSVAKNYEFHFISSPAFLGLFSYHKIEFLMGKSVFPLLETSPWIFMALKRT